MKNHEMIIIMAILLGVQGILWLWLCTICEPILYPIYTAMAIINIIIPICIILIPVMIGDTYDR